ncbi:MAG: AAA family ATPase, partial [Kofleriaceae bacterium]|nr:AAA family ATPase [Kofleriaceae bacterium]
RAELAALDAALATRADGHAVVVTVHGHPGMGKTSLVDAFAEAHRADVRLYAGRCHQSESVPYQGADGVIDALAADLRRAGAAVDDLIGPGAAALAQMFPVLRRVDAFARARRREVRGLGPHETRRAATEALRALLAGLAGYGPVALFVDDLQWASDDGVGLLIDVLAAPAPPIMAIVAYRRDSVGRAPPLDRFLAALARHPGLARTDVPVGPLERDDVGALLASRALPGPAVDAALRDTAGHPYLLARLLDADAWDGAPADLSAILAAELARLEPDARAVLEVVAIADAPLRPRTAFAAAGVDVDPAVLDRLRRHKLIHRPTSSFDADLEPYHDRVRETALAHLSEARRRALHGQLAAALETSGPDDPERLAHHHREAGDPARALRWTLRAAARATATLAFARAVELYAQAVELVGDDDRVRLDVLAELTEAQVEAGRRADAAATCLRSFELARRLGDPRAAAALRARAGEHALLAGQLDRGLELIREALGEVDVALPTSGAVAVAQSINLGAELAGRGLDFTRRAAWDVPAALARRVELVLDVARALSLTDLRAPLMATRALLDALDAGDPALVQRALAIFVVTNSARSPDHPLVVEAERRAADLADELDDDLARAWADLAAGSRAVQREAYPAALVALRDAERRFAAAGGVHAREAAFARVAIIVVCSHGVDLGYARRGHARVLAEARGRGDRYAATWIEMTRVHLHLAADEPAAARDDLRRVNAIWPRVADSLFGATALLHELAIELYEDPPAAWAAVARIEPTFRQLFTSMIGSPRAQFCRLAAAAAAAAFEAGRCDAAATARRLAPL